VRRPSRFRGFGVLAFPHISHSRVFRAFRVSDSSRFRAFRVSDSSQSHTVRNSRTRISRRLRILAHFAYFAFSHFLRFDMRYHAPPWDPSHSIRMSCPHPPRSIGAYLTWFHSHYITYVLAFTFMFIYLIMCLYYITLACLALLTRLRGLGTRLAC
jgi:hypothetical protein